MGCGTGFRRPFFISFLHHSKSFCIFVEKKKIT